MVEDASLGHDGDTTENVQIGTTRVAFPSDNPPDFLLQLATSP